MQNNPQMISLFHTIACNSSNVSTVYCWEKILFYQLAPPY